jgi:glycerol-3-phosphate acyltransferase PlsX
MGSIYVQNVLDKSNPKVALLNIGEEPTKGNELTQKTYRMLENSGLNFIGNIEGRDILTGEADVIVCDGFVGNVILKFTESLKDLLINYLGIYMRKEPRIRMGASLLSPFFEDFKSKLNYEQYGGAPLLGIDGITIVCHGNSSSEAIRNAIFVANQCARRRINKKIEDKLQTLLSSVGEKETGRARVAKPEQ